jgi:hypothetical protein
MGFSPGAFGTVISRCLTKKSLKSYEKRHQEDQR